MLASRILELAQALHGHSEKLDAYYRQHNLPFPSFEEDGPQDLRAKSQDVEDSRMAAIAASLELYHLLIGPAMQLRPGLNGSALQFIWKYNIPSKVPLGGEVSFTELATACDLHEVDVRRLLRHAMINHRIFQEKKPNFVCHTAASRRLVDDPQAMDGLGLNFDEGYQAYSRTVEALEKFKNFEPNGTGWNISKNTDKPIFDYHAEHPELRKRFTGAMATFSRGPGIGPETLVQGYDWSSVGGCQGTVVDIGGADGYTSTAIARAVPGLRFIVQDLPGVVQNSEGGVAKELQDRVKFMAHDFSKPQPVQADVYLLRQVIHNWPDPASISTLRALVPAMRPGAKILVNDRVVPPPGKLPFVREKVIRDTDLIMLSLLSAREREAPEWRKLFEEADPRYTDVRIWKPEGSAMSIIEATWSG